MKKILLAVVVIGLAAGAAWYFLKHRAAAAEPNAGKPSATVETTALVEGPIAETIEVFGLVVAAPSGEKMLSVPYDVVVRKIDVSSGALVAADEVLLEVEPSPDAKLAADSARSLLALADKSLAGTKERYELRLATRQELQTAQQAAEDARLKADRFGALESGRDREVRAPAAGVVSKLDLLPGAVAPTGTALVTVATGNEREVRFSVEAREAGRVQRGQTVTLSSAQRGDGETLTTTVRTVGGVLDATSGAVDVRATLPGDAPLFLGEHVHGRIELQQKPRALLVPRSAVLPDGDTQVMFTVKDGKAVRHEVKVGLRTDDLTEVTGEGLHAGDAVVTLGNYELEDGMAVQPPATPEKKAQVKAGEKPAAEEKP